jgi:2-phospho-L-lactate guanylyltransferase
VSRAGTIWAVVPVKEFAAAKQRLAGSLPAEARRMLAAAMFEDVLGVLASAPGLAGIVVVTCDPLASTTAERVGARIASEQSREGQTAAVGAAARLLAGEGVGGMLTVPGDVPLISVDEVGAILAAHRPSPSFTIVPAHDRRGSNAVLCSPPDAVPLRFGNDSFVPHLAAARRRGINPTILPLPGIGLDIDRPADLARLRVSPHRRTRTFAVLDGLDASRVKAADVPRG